MRQILKKLWLWYGMMMKTLMSLLSVLLFSSWRLARRINMLAKTVDTSRKAFVLGNGPSLKDVLHTPKLFEELTQGDVMVTNRFAISDNFRKLRPHYYILLDPAFSNEDFINSDASVREMYDALNEVDWPLVLFLSKETNIEIVKRYLVNSKIQVIQYNGTTIIGPKRFQNWLYKHGMGVPSSRNVIIPAIMMMINIGYKNIYIYGAEFSWTKNFDVDPRNNRVFLNNGHFYKDEDIIYCNKGYYHYYLKCVDEMLTGTEQIAIYAENCGAHVINRTKGSFIDAFDYENPDTIEKKS